MYVTHQAQVLQEQKKPQYLALLCEETQNYTETYFSGNLYQMKYFQTLCADFNRTLTLEYCKKRYIGSSKNMIKAESESNISWFGIDCKNIS